MDRRRSAQMLEDAIEILRSVVASSDANDGESLMNAVESAREFLEQLEG